MRKVTVQLVDDIDGSVIDEGSGRTVSFSLDGDGYELDLSNENIDRLREALNPYIGAARRLSKGRGRASSNRSSNSASGSSSDELQAIRAWANENGFSVASRGRISAEVREAYARANG